MNGGDMLSCCFKEALGLELTFSDLDFPPFPKTHTLMSLALRGLALRQMNPIKVNSYSYLSQKKAAKETMFGTNAV